MASDYSHTPEDIRDAITDYDKEVNNGDITPWTPAPANPGPLYEYSDEYENKRASDDPWLGEFINDHLPPEYTGYAE